MRGRDGSCNIGLHRGSCDVIDYVLHVVVDGSVGPLGRGDYRCVSSTIRTFLRTISMNSSTGDDHRPDDSCAVGAAASDSRG